MPGAHGAVYVTGRQPGCQVGHQCGHRRGTGGGSEATPGCSALRVESGGAVAASPAAAQIHACADEDGHGGTAVYREIAIRYWSSGTSVRLTLLLTILFAAYPVAEMPVKVNSAAGTGGSPVAGCARNWITK